MRDGQVACPHCSHGFSRTLLTQKTRRRRQCTKCLKRFTTYEKYADHLYTRALTAQVTVGGNDAA
jgi:transcriptional regulator NrdR family protein